MTDMRPQDSHTSGPGEPGRWPTAYGQSGSPPWPPPPADTPPPPPTGNARAYPPGRITAIVIGVLLTVVGVIALGAGSAVLWLNLGGRHNGYVTVAANDYRTTGYALTSDRVTLWGSGHLWYQASLLGDVRVTANSTNPATPVFIGIAPADSAQAYLATVQHSTVTHLSGGRDTVIDHGGTAPATKPADTHIWTASVSGTGTQTLNWTSTDGTWMLVVMNADGSAPVSAHLNLGITAPSLAWISGTMFGIAVLFLTAGVLLIAIPMSRAVRARKAIAETTANRYTYQPPGPFEY